MNSPALTWMFHLVATPLLVLAPQHRTHLIHSCPSAKAPLGALTGPIRRQIDYTQHKPAPDLAAEAREKHNDH